MKPLQTLCSIALLVSTTLFMSAHALAAAADAPPQRVVKFGDLDLGSPDGVKALYFRISAAANAVCHTESGAPYLNGSRAHRACVQDAMDRAIADVNNRNLTAYCNQRTGRGASAALAKR